MNIYESISRIMAEATPISKDKLNKKQGFKYRGIDDVMNTFYPLLAKHKVFIVPEVVGQQREERSTKSGDGNLIYSILKIKFTFYAEDGSNISAVVIGEGMDRADKSSNKAMAVGMKYAMFQVFCIPTEDMIDPDSESHPKSVPFSEITEEEKGEEIEIWHRLQEAKEIFIPNTQTQLKSLTKAQLQRLTTKLAEMPEQAKAASYILQHDKSIQ